MLSVDEDQATIALTKPIKRMGRHAGMPGNRDKKQRLSNRLPDSDGKYVATAAQRPLITRAHTHVGIEGDHRSQEGQRELERLILPRPDE